MQAGREVTIEQVLHHGGPQDGVGQGQLEVRGEAPGGRLPETLDQLTRVGATGDGDPPQAIVSPVGGRGTGAWPPLPAARR